MTTLEDEGSTLYPTLDTVWDGVQETSYTVDASAGPTSAAAESKCSRTVVFNAAKAEPITAKMETLSKMEADEKDFKLTNELRVFLDGEEFFTKTWHDIVPRDRV